MRKIASAVTLGLLLVAGQSLAQTSASAPRIADRIGAPMGEASNLQAFNAGMTVISLLGVVGTIAALSALTEDDSESD
ncbi:MAG: hypothetical protein EON90_06235 [Brevundimonas sp.]|nr:MAG: hypothetical protein EON90_06235 [Brevundimonas sp.]